MLQNCPRYFISARQYFYHYKPHIFSSFICSIAPVPFKLWDICFLIIWHFYLIVLMLYKSQFWYTLSVSHLILFLVLFVTFLHWHFFAHALFSLQSFRSGFNPILQNSDDVVVHYNLPVVETLSTW